MIKSMSSNKYNLNLSNYKVIINRKNINLNLNKISKNQILKKILIILLKNILGILVPLLLA